MRFLTSLCAAAIFFGSVAWSQSYPRPRPHRPMQPQTAADFSPDPPPVPTPTPPPQIQPQMPPRATPAPGTAPATIPSPTPALAPEHLPPATPPQVTFANGLLTVDATNSSLGALLTAIRNKTGIQFEGLENGAPERVAISMGPAPEGDVLTGILAGSGFDYVIVERPDSPGIVQRVLLTAKGGATTGVASGTQPTAQNSPVAVSDDDDEDAAEEPATPQDTPVRPPIAQQVPPQPQVPKTPEQYYEEMKRMPQQQQQGQAPPNPAPIKPSPPHP